MLPSSPLCNRETAARGREYPRACIILLYIYQGLLGPRDASGFPRLLGNRIAIILELFQTAARSFAALEYVGERAAHPSTASSDKLDFDWKTKQSAGPPAPNYITLIYISP